MSTILEVSTKGNTLYEMPDDVYGIVVHAVTVDHMMHRRRERLGISGVVAMLPEYWRNQIKVSPSRPPARGVRGVKAKVLVYEDAFSQTGVRCHGWDGPCDSLNAARRRQRTSYEDDRMNWVTLCDQCMAGNHEMWDEMWREYYADKL